MTRSGFHSVVEPGPSCYLVFQSYIQWIPDSVARYRAAETREGP